MLIRDRGEFSVSIELAPGISIEQNNQATLSIERIFAQIPEIEKFYRRWCPGMGIVCPFKQQSHPDQRDPRPKKSEKVNE